MSTFPTKGDNFRAIPAELHDMLLRDWLTAQADMDRRTAEQRKITAPDRTAEAAAAIERERERARLYQRNKAKAARPAPTDAAGDAMRALLLAHLPKGRR